MGQEFELEHLKTSTVVLTWYMLNPESAQRPGALIQFLSLSNSSGFCILNHKT